MRNDINVNRSRFVKCIIIAFSVIMLSVLFFPKAWAATGKITLNYAEARDWSYNLLAITNDTSQIFKIPPETAYVIAYGTLELTNDDTPSGPTSLPNPLIPSWMGCSNNQAYLFPRGFYYGPYYGVQNAIVYSVNHFDYQQPILNSKGEPISNYISRSEPTLINGLGSYNISAGSSVSVFKSGKVNINIYAQDVYSVNCANQIGYARAGDVFAQATFKFRYSSCDLKIAVTPYVINQYIGGNINISSNISDSSGKPITWQITLPNGQTINGSGTNPTAYWDGKDANGKLVEAGRAYSATITAQNEDGCSDTATVPITVSPSPDENICALQVQVGSSANVANGNLSHSQELFSSKGSALPLDMSLYYNSADPNNGSLGLSWSHSYDISLNENTDGSILLKEGNWQRTLYTASGGSYIPQPNDYSTLVKNSDSTYTITQKDGTKYNFNSDGKITTIVDRNGNTDTFAYTGGNLTSITDPGGRTAALAYDSDNHLISVTDPSGNSYTFTYASGTLSSVTYPDGGVWHYTYDDKAFMLTKTDPMGNTTTYTYDDSHRIASSKDPEGKTRSVSYPTGTDTVKTTTFTEKDGGVWQYTYDTTKGTLNQKIDPQGGVTSYTYDGNGNTLSTTKPDGTTTGYTYDAQGNMTSTTDALGQTTSYTYNNLGEVLSIKDPQGNTTSNTYDTNGNMTAMTDPAGATTKYEYDAKGNIVKVTNPLGQATVFTYDTGGNLASVTDPAGAKTTFTYDATGNMISQTDTSGAATKFEYNAKNQLVKTTDPKGNVTTYAYDLAGNKVSETDANGNTTNYEYNAKGQVVKSKDALGNVTVFTYGGTGCASCGGGTDKLTSLTDANGNATTYNYDNLGRLLNETDPIGNIASYSYDANGNLTAKTDANGNTIKYGYDSLGRLAKKTYPDGTEETFTYDAKGNILTATNKNISYTFTYDASGKVLSVTDSNGREVQYDYDLAGRMTKLTYPEGSVVNYGYDKAGRLATITNSGKTFSFNYDDLGRRTKLDYPDGTTAEYGYDEAGRLTSLVHKKNFGPTIDSFTYNYDKVGNRLSKAEPEVKINYNYDKIYRLLQALPERGRYRQIVSQSENYTYDPVGNRLTGPLDILSYIYDQGNQLTDLTGQPKGIIANGKPVVLCHNEHDKAEYSYDKNGNLVKKVEPAGPFQFKTTTLYSYDFENRLIKVETQREHWENVVTFTYDPFGRRLSKTVQKEEIEDKDNDWHGEKCEHGHKVPRTTSYVYDNEDIILEYNGRGDATSRYVHGPGVDEPLALYSGRETYYYHADGLGSITALTDRQGQVVQKYEYDSFGNLKEGLGFIDQPYTYTGREWDKETGLYYYRARYYDPTIGRFINRDPIGILGNIYNNQYNVSFDQYVSSVQNTYAYTENNPVNYIDPSGLWSLSVGVYYGYGGTVTFGRDNGKSFVMVEGGVGIGGKLKFKPFGRFPDVPNKDACDKGGFLGFSGGAGGYLGPASLAWEGKAGLGISNLPGEPPKTNYIEKGSPEVGIQKRGWGVGLGIHLGVAGGVMW
jgi:RHS repeat-associated protein